VDLVSLATVAALFVSFVVGDAALYGNSLFVHLDVPTSVAERGFTEDAAELTFASEIGRFARAEPTVPTPSVQTSTTPSLPMVVAKPFQMADVVHALQANVRSDLVSVTGSIIAAPTGSRLTMAIIVTNPPDPPTEHVLIREDGDVRLLIKSAARVTMEKAAPYRVALTDMAAALDGNKAAFEHARNTALFGLTQAPDPSVPGRTELVMLHNLLAVLALRDGDQMEASGQFSHALAISGAAEAAYGTITLNRAFMAVIDRQPAPAMRLLQTGIEQTSSVNMPAFTASISELKGIVALSAGKPAEAEQDFRSALDIVPDEQVAHHYLAGILAARGDKEGAAAELAASLTKQRSEGYVPGLAHTIVLVDPIAGGVLATSKQ
jgi:hypothetical protein